MIAKIAMMILYAPCDEILFFFAMLLQFGFDCVSFLNRNAFDFCDFFRLSLKDTLDGAKLRNQFFSAGWSNSRDGIQPGSQPDFTTPVTVRGDGKTMSLIPDALDQVIALGMIIKSYRFRHIGQKKLFFLFYQTNDCELPNQTNFLQNIHCLA